MTKILLLLLLSPVIMSQLMVWPQMQTSCNMWGYYWDGQKCEQCAMNCQCNSYLGCSSCNTGYYMNNQSWCDWCEGNQMGNVPVTACCDHSLMTGNYKATLATSCANTIDLFGTTLGLYGSVCGYITGCTQYNTNGYATCATCNTGFYLDPTSTQCLACNIPGCLSCSGPGQCTTCKPMWYLNAYVTSNSTNFQSQFIYTNASTCTACNSGCLCNDYTNLCLSCNSPMYFPNPNVTTSLQCALCSAQMTYCITCSYSSNTFTCNACQTVVSASQYVYLTGGTCVQCPANCYQCSSTTVCLSNGCINGYFFSSGSCQSCLNSTNNAGICSGLNAISQCQTDNAGGNQAPHLNQYYLVNGNATTQCIQNQYSCMTMNNNFNNGSCTACYPNYILTPDGRCTICPVAVSNCVACIPVAKAVFQRDANCTTCTYGYFVNSGTCSACTANCETCSSSSICTQCFPNYMLVAPNTCNQCQDKNCIQCNTNTSICQNCQVGFRAQQYADQTTRCESCDAQCLQCSSNRKQCTQCANGYYVDAGMNGMSGCHKMPVNCAVFNTTGGCTVCHYGYRLVNGMCVSCFNPTLGQIDCPGTCGAQFGYRRDGVYYTAALEAARQQHQTATNGFVIYFALLAFICLFAFIF